MFELFLGVLDNIPFFSLNLHLQLVILNIPNIAKIVMAGRMIFAGIVAQIFFFSLLLCSTVIPNLQFI